MCPGVLRRGLVLKRNRLPVFIDQVLKAGDRSAIFAIDQEPRFEQGLDTAARATSKLKSITPAKGATAFFDTVIDAARYLAKSAPLRTSPRNRCHLRR